MKQHDNTNEDKIHFRDVLEYINEPERRKKLLSLLGVMAFIAMFPLLAWFGPKNYTLPTVMVNIMTVAPFIIMIGVIIYGYRKGYFKPDQD